MRLIYILLFIPLISCSQDPFLTNDDDSSLGTGDLNEFAYGVASGDPTTSSVVLWTKLTLINKEKTIVKWEVSTDSTFKNIVKAGKYVTDARLDYIVKHKIEGLKPGTHYYYRFSTNYDTSPIGQTQTLPEHIDDDFTIAFAACSNYEWGYFNAYRAMANDPDIDLVVHLGDYIYEYGVGVYGDTTIGRLNQPAHEIITLDDYRTRYALYRRDPDLQKLHQMKPMITTWDDHEIANNAYDNGAQNHSEDEGDWNTRKNIARKVYYEWMPIEMKNDEPLYRSFQIGQLMNLIILDTRLGGRTEQVYEKGDERLQDTNRTILGHDQFQWLKKELQTDATWKIIGNQVPFGPMYLPDEKQDERYMDGWDGYPYDREKFINNVIQNDLKNIVFVTGDYHRSFVMKNDLNGSSSEEDDVSTEFVVTSITSANDDEYVDANKCEVYRKMYLKNNPHMSYCNNTDHGYFTLKVSQEKAIGKYFYVSTLRKIKFTIQESKEFVVPVE